MKINLTVLLLLLLGLEGSAQTTPSLNLGCAIPPIINGTMGQGEWDNADTIRIAIDLNKSVRISFMRDLENMYFLFAGNLESQFKFPEILFDVNNSKSSSWETDDWWFHISATDCENLGAYGVYSNCQLVQPDWVAVNNITQGQPITDTVEVSIPFSKIGFVESLTNTSFGLSFVLNGFNSGSYSWPLGSNKLNPSTWGDMLIGIPFCNMTRLKEIDNHRYFKLYPIPSAGTFTLEYEELGNITYTIQVTDIIGNQVSFEAQYSAGRIDFELEKKPGLYFLNIIDSNETIKTIKLIQY